MHRVLLTGSEGFLGRHVRSELLARGMTVIGVSMPGKGAELGVDLSDPDFSAEELLARTGPVDAILYLAARITRGSSVDGDARRNLRAIATAPVEMLEAYGQANAELEFVYCSSITVYGPHAAALGPATSPLRPNSNTYGSAKALGERLLEISRCRGSRCSIVRPSYIYGPGQPASRAIPAFLRSCWKGIPPTVYGDGQQRRDDVLVTDVAYCMAEACQRRVQGTLNACGERSRTLLEVAELCCRAVEKLGGPSGLVPLVDPSRAPAPWIDQDFDISETRAKLAYEPVPLFEGLCREAIWIREGT